MYLPGIFIKSQKSLDIGKPEAGIPGQPFPVGRFSRCHVDKDDVYGALTMGKVIVPETGEYIDHDVLK